MKATQKEREREREGAFCENSIGIRYLIAILVNISTTRFAAHSGSAQAVGGLD